ncbi:heterokaryon incompatibility protein [Apiospora arundinis]|uniref:Heterokaryon incompatibility protein n=1 Tax=Apiospora arundinis TaxID=335852 RepID=A0ABR2IHM0_9PEZI
MASTSENPFSRLVNQNSSTAVARLAVLEPSADPDSPIRLTLTDAPLNSTSYECISYDREDESSGTVKVLVDDAEQEIPAPLASALRTFRRREQSRHVWADLLVGRTVEERSTQGPVMRQILSHADKTLCWIGSGDNALTSLAFDTLREMANRYLQACLHVGLSQDISLSRCTIQQMQGIRERLHDCPYNDLHSFNFDLWKVIDGILGAQYWSSVHSIPDIVSAKLAIIVCGRSNMRWSNYIAASRCYPFLRGKFFGGVPLLPSVQKGFEIANAIELAERRKRLGESIELFPMIQTARDCGSKDTREYVFAMLKIATPSARIKSHKQGPQPLPVIDYSKSAQQVFTEAAKYTILERQDLMVWYAELPPCQKVLKGLPSWVPDFGGTTPKGRIASPNGGFRQWWEALQPIKPLRISDDGDNALHVQAQGLARVAHVSPVFDAGNLTRLCYREFEKLPEPETWETAEQRNERYWRTLVTNSGGFEAHHSFADNSPLKADVGLSFRSVMAQERILALLGCTPIELQNPSPELRARYQTNPEVQSLIPLTGKGTQYENLLRHYALGRRFFRTEDGRFGMTATEDVVAVDGDLSQERNRQKQRSDGSSASPTVATTQEPNGEGNAAATGAAAENAQPEENGEGAPTGRRPNMGRMMADPMARAMLESFQQFLTIRDPTAANLVSGMIRGDFPGASEEGAAAGQAATDPDFVQGVRPGDLVVALVGGFYPYILRPVEQPQENQDTAAEDTAAASGEPAAAEASSASSSSNSNSNTAFTMADATYEFVGDCYLYGAMDGEDWLATSTLTGQQFFRVDRSKLVDIRIV